MAIVSVSDLKRTYEEGAVAVRALDGVDFALEEGEFTALMGPSGSGKTTLLNLIGGLDEPTAGEVVVDGKDLSKMREQELSRMRLEHIGFVFQAYNLLPVLSAYENAEFVLMMRGMPKVERHEKVMAVLEAVGLKGMEHRRPSELSGGQQQRVAVARAIVGEPALVLADEPTANLDSKTGHELVALMRELNEKRGITFLFATHDPKVMESAKRVVRMVDGRIDEDVPQMITLLAVVAGVCEAAEIASWEEGSFDLGADFKTFFVETFPYEHDLISSEPTGQAIADGRLKAVLRHGAVRFEGHQVITNTIPGSTSGVGIVSTGAGLKAPEVVELGWDAVSNSSVQVSGRVDRLLVAAKVPHLDIAVGRQPITIGKAYFFTPLDLVNPFSPAVIDQEYKPGVDSVRVDGYIGMMTQITGSVAYAGSWDADGLIASLYGQTTLGIWDLGVFGGLVRAEPVLGLATAGSVGPIGVRGEGTLTLPEEEDPFVRTTVGGDWRPTATTTVSGEVYYQSFGKSDPGDYLELASGPRFLRGEIWSMGRYYAGLSANQEITPITFVSVFGIANLEDGSALVGPSLAWSLASNADLAAGAYVGLGKRPGTAEVLGFPILDVQSEFGLVPTTAFMSLNAYL